MIGLDIQTMQAGEYKLLIQLDMEELFSGKTMATFGYIKPKGNILTQLRQWIDTDIETIYKVIAQQERKHTICVTTSLQQEVFTNCMYADTCYTKVSWPGLI